MKKGDENSSERLHDDPNPRLSFFFFSFFFPLPPLPADIKMWGRYMEECSTLFPIFLLRPSLLFLTSCAGCVLNDEDKKRNGRAVLGAPSHFFLLSLFFFPSFFPPFFLLDEEVS